MALGICISCGQLKRSHLKQCSNCGFKPSSDLEMAKSLYLSVAHYFGEDEQSSYFTKQQLADFSQQIKSGKGIEFKQAIIDRILAQKREFDSMPISAGVKAVFRLLLPGIIFLLMLFGFVYWLKH